MFEMKNTFIFTFPVALLFSAIKSAHPLTGDFNKTTDVDIHTCKIPNKPRHEVEL
jgi:hypothetical protein